MKTIDDIVYCLNNPNCACLELRNTHCSSMQNNNKIQFALYNYIKTVTDVKALLSHIIKASRQTIIATLTECGEMIVYLRYYYRSNVK